MSTSSRLHGEAVRVELREVEHVADEPLEPRRLGRDDVERRAHQLRVVDEPSRSASTWPWIAVSGVRSSCETDIRNWRSSSSVSASRAAISRNRSERWQISSPPRPRRDLDGVVALRDLVGRVARAPAPARVIRRESHEREQPCEERPPTRTRARAARAAAATGRGAPSFGFATTIAPSGSVVPLEPERLGGREVASGFSPGGVNSNGDEPRRGRARRRRARLAAAASGPSPGPGKSDAPT